VRRPRIRVRRWGLGIRAWHRFGLGRLIGHAAGIIPRMSRAVVTGGAGFIGSHVADAFFERGYDVVVVDDLSAGKRENVPERAELAEVDITDAESLATPLDGADVVCHLAAQASVTVSVERPEHDCNVNVHGTLNVCELARRSNAPVIFASSGGALYGDDVPLPSAEDLNPQPLAPYGASKQAGEAYVQTWARLYGLPNVVLRLGNVYGPRQNTHGEAGVVAIFSTRLLAGEPPSLRGEGKPTRDYVHVGDVARAFVLAAESGKAGVYNVGTGVQTSTLRLLEILQDAAGTSLEPQPDALKEGELEASALDASRIERELGWRPTVAVDEGLRETFAWYREGRGG
jgi:UDP-glucose 4-epimerase